jgi:hypothetical protein
LARLEHNFISDRTPVSTHFHRFRVVRVASMLQGTMSAAMSLFQQE